jgi:hypothetical protein
MQQRNRNPCADRSNLGAWQRQARRAARQRPSVARSAACPLISSDCCIFAVAVLMPRASCAVQREATGTQRSVPGHRQV